MSFTPPEVLALAELQVGGLDELIRDLDSLAEETPALCNQILQAQANVVEPALKRSLALKGLRRTGRLLASISRRKGRSKGGPAIRIGPSGEHHRYYPKTGSGVVSAGYVGYIHEYGLPGRGIKASKWAATAVSDSREKAMDAAEQIHDQILKKHNF